MAKVEGLIELQNNLRLFRVQAQSQVKKAVFHGAVLIQNEAKMSHPYVDRTGNLTNSIQAKPAVSTSPTKIEAETIAGMDYAGSVELGSGQSSPYPFMFPAMERMSGPIAHGIVNILRSIKWVE